MLAACSTGGDGGGVPVAEDARFFVARPDRSTQDLDGLDAWLEAVPFDVVLPASVPEGARLFAAQLTLPDPRFGDSPPPRMTEVMLSFSGLGGDADGGFAVFQAGPGANPVTMVDEGVVAVDLPGATAAQLVELPLDGQRAPSATLVVWRACGVDFSLTAPGADVMPRDEVLDLVRAFIEGCES
jgi:hypothetical protein